MSADVERVECTTIFKENGAYLIVHGQNGNEATSDAGTLELCNAAGSLTKAKRVAVEGARSFGFGGAVRWEQSDSTFMWTLTMTNEEDS